MMILTVGKGVGMKNNNIIEISNLSFAYSAKNTGLLSIDKTQNILKNISINIKLFATLIDINYVT